MEDIRLLWGGMLLAATLGAALMALYVNTSAHRYLARPGAIAGAVERDWRLRRMLWWIAGITAVLGVLCFVSVPLWPHPTWPFLE